MKGNLLYLLHDGSQFGIRRLVHLAPVHWDFDLLVELKDDNGVL